MEKLSRTLRTVFTLLAVFAGTWAQGANAGATGFVMFGRLAFPKQGANAAAPSLYSGVTTTSTSLAKDSVSKTVTFRAMLGKRVCHGSLEVSWAYSAPKDFRAKGKLALSEWVCSNSGFQPVAARVIAGDGHAEGLPLVCRKVEGLRCVEAELVTGTALALEVRSP